MTEHELLVAENQRLAQVVTDNSLDAELLAQVLQKVRHALEDSIDRDSMLSDIMIELHKLKEDNGAR